jgi:hypothetical protein
VVAYDADPRYGSIVSGIPGGDIEEVSLSQIHIWYRGGLDLDQVAKQPAGLMNTFFFRGSSGVPPLAPFDTPEREKEYPEPSMFGMMPAYGFFLRHTAPIRLSDVDVHFLREDGRPAFMLDHVRGAMFQSVEAQKAAGASTFVLKNVEEFTAHQCLPIPDVHVARAARRDF